MSFVDTLRGLSSAEEFFNTLEVPYDSKILNVARLHILRRMHTYLEDSQESEKTLNDDEQRTLYKRHLTQAYTDFTKSSPMEERVFQVHKNAVKPATLPMVSLSSLKLPPEKQ
ncbi:nitrogenase stabilizing/protective protein NifW [Zymomonas mobilis]|uniref:Nitrogenase-stabilizing/protective protein NifW n=1 Tax=Zymomonas mobilis subsp. pomaceae (strain ATCC 29192 / DSM 22645 / JCM 10191 / CCUG 17912 / NBRC 13757 / NCIMB 11200 / NRRL B-4491 / Barker I) TaxID=579138 RepID=F8EUP3_ZYMMT|nr:nitrogenase stabilizing/protective protein NifW [Zymomonas mobilis]AEI38189.1 nitrogen fixation protein NifW [Zymomonas mobilis subsp. pomaceae ATCC 29192]MDX5947879.1 nitrogenase stabilizing/protective protein NifW [Zymomonas mobilis subsp. pomaceae]GEB89957.1 nitrogenase-stabilizing/protective protein NifW [Zymomonas mobilis subsp. pomaceae]